MQESCVLSAALNISVVYTIEKEVAVVNTASDYCVGHRYGGVPVKMFATFIYNKTKVCSKFNFYMTALLKKNVKI